MKIVMGLPPRQSSGSVAIDLELFEANPNQLHRPFGRLACAQFCPDGKTVYVVTSESDLEKALNRVDRAEWVFHTASFDIAHLRRWASVPPRPASHFWDVFLMEKILWSGWFDDFGLGDLSRRYLLKPLKKQVRKKFYDSTELSDEMIAYAAQDAWATWKIRVEQQKWLNTEPNLWNVWEEVDAPAFWALLDLKGFHLNEKKWLELSKEQRAIAQEKAQKLGFNPNSPKQTLYALRSAGLNIDSTGEEVIAPFRNDYPIVADILDAREAAKLAGTYGEEFCKKYLESDGAIHSNYNVTGAVTGRMSSDDPNGQNMPRDLRYRACFVALRGMRLIVADVAQQEPRITAQLSHDERLIAAIARGEDLHWAVTRAIFDLPENAPMNKELRRLGKAINLGLVYGLTAYGLSAKTGLSESEAERLLNTYFARFPGVRKWMQETRRESQKSGRVETLMHRVHHLNLWARQAQNSMVNTPVQGSAADATKLSLGYMHRLYGSDLPIVAVVHDEFVAEVPTKTVKKVSRDITECLTRAFQRVAPDAPTVNLVDLHVGSNWACKSD